MDGPEAGSVKGRELHSDSRRQQFGGGVLVWAGIIKDKLVGPFRVEDGVNLNSQTYCQFLEDNFFKQWYRKKSVNQLQHELSKKDDLLRVVSIASEESETDSSCSTPLRANDSFSFTHGLLQLDNLHGKLRELERRIWLYVPSQLTDELSNKSEEIVRYQEEISTVLSQIVDLQHKLRESAIEKEEFRIHLQASKEAQRQLTAELHDLQDRNAECEGILQEAQDELKMLRCKASPSALLRRPQSCSVFPVDSLAAEIEGTMRRELSLEEESSFGERKKHPKRVFDTVKVANELRSRSSSMPLAIPGSNRSGVVMTALPFESGAKTEEKKTKICSAEDVKEKDFKGLAKSEILDDSLETALHRLHLRRQNFLSEKQFFRDECERNRKRLEDEREHSGCSTPTGSVMSLATHFSDCTDSSATSSSLRSLLPEKLQIVKPLEGSQTLHHWQQLAQPNLGTILDPRPGVLTKGFKPLPEDAEYHLCDLEEDDKEDDEDDEGGITFKVYERDEGDVPKSSSSIFLPPISLAPATTSVYVGFTSCMCAGKVLIVKAKHDFTVTLACQRPKACSFGRLLDCVPHYTKRTTRIQDGRGIQVLQGGSSKYTSSLGGPSSSSANTFVSSPSVSCRPSLGEYFGKASDSSVSSTSNLAKLLKEQGISAKVNSPLVQEKPSRPQNLLLPSTPPNSPSRSPCPSPLTFEPNPSENFLAVSRPAESFLQEMYGLKSTRSQADLKQMKMSLVERLKRLGIARVVSQPSTEDQTPALNNGLKQQESTMFVATSSLIGGIRRNQSLPAIIGGLSAPVCTSSPKMSSLKED
ncbi:unnamed protein product [Ranitomeya imitator]|uniref:Trafficking kinesin-binding protein 2 n=1 Tax=Ranitomeya imitator TaxID=111125 RepID=A0ABN9LF93_9NEOB|nr:unnamed protein product [Ranitomeya imitator]